MKFGILAIAAVGLAACTTSPSQQAEIGYPKGSLGYAALVRGDLGKAEAQLAGSPVDAADPARLLNMAQLYRMTDRELAARDLYNKVLASENPALVLSNGRVITAHEAARLGLSAEMTAAK